MFGLELDLDHYMIVAVGDFNMGAMENKGLNIFNTKYVLARPDIATDTDFMLIDRVVAHEYFHNWTGNRVTCRDDFVGGYTTFTGGYRTRGVNTRRGHRRGLQGCAGAARSVGAVHVHAGGDDPEGSEPRPAARHDEGPVGDPAAGDVGGLRRQRREDDPRLADAGDGDARGSGVPATSRRTTPGGRRDSTSTRWVAAGWGRDPKKSLLNEWNQLHSVRNVFVTDGACMTSTGNQSPSILYMALTARAANHAASELAKQNL